VRLLRFRRHPVSEQELSVYLDTQTGKCRLSARDEERVEAHLQSCVDCSRKLEEMRLLVAEMRRLPQATAPRSFAISPELAAATRREAERSRQEKGTAARRVYLGFSGATAAAVVLLIAVAGVDLLASRDAGQGEPSGFAAASRQSAESATTDQSAEALAGGDENAVPGVAPIPSAVSEDDKALSRDAATTPASVAAAPDGEGTTDAQQAQPADEENQHLWLWVVEGAAGGLIIGFGASAFWMRRRWVQINRS